MKQQTPKTLPQKAETIENTRKTADILIGAACHQAEPKRYQREKPRSFNDFRVFLRPIFEVGKKDIKNGFGKFDGPVPLPKAF